MTINELHGTPMAMLAGLPPTPVPLRYNPQALCPRGRLNIYIYICMKFH